MLAAAYTATELLLIIGAISSAITGILVAYQHKTLKQVELQGNSRELENKRIQAMLSKRVADESGKSKDIQVAADMEKVYRAALVAAAKSLQ